MGLLITSSSAEIWICFVDLSGKPISAGRNGGAMPPMDGQLAPILTQRSCPSQWRGMPWKFHTTTTRALGQSERSIAARDVLDQWERGTGRQLI